MRDDGNVIKMGALYLRALHRTGFAHNWYGELVEVITFKRLTQNWMIGGALSALT